LTSIPVNPEHHDQKPKMQQRKNEMLTTQMMKRRGFLQGTAAIGALALAGVPRIASAEMYNMKLNIMSHPGQILPIFAHHIEYLK